MLRVTWHFTLDNLCSYYVPLQWSLVYISTFFLQGKIGDVKKKSFVKGRKYLRKRLFEMSESVKLISSLLCHIARHTCALLRVATKLDVRVRAGRTWAGHASRESLCKQPASLETQT